jgi:hypothetical protein
MPKREGKYSEFLKDQHILRWFKNLARGSPTTAEVAVRRLSKFSELFGADPNTMVALAKKDLPSFQDKLEDIIAKLESEKKSPGYTQGILKIVKSWLRYNDITLTRKIRISNPKATPTIENERVPLQEELARILRASPTRVKSAIALMAFADLRPQVLGNYDGSDGLRIRDLPELRVENGEAKFEKIPTMIVVRATLSKAKHRYFTFLADEGCTYLKEYLEERIRDGEELRSETPLIGHDRQTASTKPFMLTRKITLLIRQCLRKAGFRKRPYVLRAYAETQLIIAESKGKISHPYLQFIAGHVGDIEARYSTNKGSLTPDMVEDMRGAYEKSQPFIQSIKAEEPSEEKLRRAFRTQFLLVSGFSQDDIDKMDLPSLTNENLQEIVKKKLLGANNNHSKQKTVNMNEIESYLAQGWEYVANLGKDKVVIRWTEPY